MANIKSALKRIRSSEKRRQRNQGARTAARSYIKKARSDIDAGNFEQAKKAVALAVSALDKAAEKGIIHKNNATRRKSRLMLRLSHAMGQAPS